MLLAAAVRRGTLLFAYRYSPKSPQTDEGGEWRAPFATQTSKPGRVAFDFRSAPNPIGGASKRDLRSGIDGAARAAQGLPDGGKLTAVTPSTGSHPQTICRTLTG